jgi:cytochrome c biogenesis factor
VNGLSAENFNTPVGLLSLVGMLVLVLCLVWRDLGRKRVVQVAGVALLAGLVAGLLFDASLAAFATPILLVAMAGAGYKVVRSFDRRRALPSLGLVGAHLIHLSVVLILIGYVGSTLLPEETNMALSQGGPEQEFGGYSFKMTGLDYDNHPVSGYAFANVEVRKGDRLIETARPGAQLIGGQVRGEVAVVRTLGEDVYLVYHNSSGSGSNTLMNMSVKTLPLMNVLWLGMVLMWIGIIVRMVAEPLTRRRRGEGAKKREPEPYGPTEEDEEPPDGTDEGDEGDKDDAYYEDLLEKELERL